MKKTVLFCLAAALILSGCNTISGAGKDLQGAGEWTADSAHKVQKKIDEQ